MTHGESHDGPGPLLRGLTWEEQVVGLSFRTARRTVTETDLVNFITGVGMNEPLFVDATFVEEQTAYTGRLVPGALTYSIAEGLLMQTGVIHGTGMAFLRMELEVKGPVYVGDTIEVVVEVTESRETSKPGRGLVTTRNRVLNQRGEEVLVFTPVRMIRGKDS